MILDPNRPRSAGRRLSACAVLTVLFTLALGLSLVSWRPMSAQDDPAAESAHAPASGEIRVYPLIGPARFTRTLPAPPAEGPAIMIELKLLTLDLRAIADAKVDLPVMPDRPAAVGKGGVVSIHLDGKEASRLVDIVLGVKGAEMLSQPQIMTRDGQEASLVVGGEMPIVEIDEIFNGERRERRIEFKEFGTKLRVTPRILPEDRRKVRVEIVGEKTAVNSRRKDGDNQSATPLLNTVKLELAETVELGKTLVVLSPGNAEGGPEDNEPQKSLLILLRPSLVEHKYVEVDPNLGAAARNPAALPNTSAGLNAGDEAKLAEQLRAIRKSLEALAREREVSRQENAALKAELERLKAQMSRPPQPAPSPYRDPQLVPDGGTDAVRRSIEWLENSKKPLTFDPHRDGDRDAALAAKLQTERLLLELDLQAAEVELEAADADFRDAQKLLDRKAISDQEYRNKRLTLERAKIQLARIKVQLEASHEPRPVTAR